MKPITVHEWGQLIEEIAKCMQTHHDVGLWWRGQANSKWDLVPGTYRGSAKKFEQTRCNNFILKGKSRHSVTPAHNDYVSWLFLMQHYRLHTRLLDWTESPLIALYFAIAEAESEKRSAALWGLNPSKLNSCQAGREGTDIILPRAPAVLPIIKDAFEFSNVPHSQKILAIAVEEFDIRHMVQMSACTIHGVSTPSNQLGESDQFLVKLEIPAKDREVFKQGLQMLGINRSMLFPDLENLAKELNSKTFTK